MPEEPKQENYSVTEDDAVCFSAGLTGAPFGAGCIHAYLASDRQPPKVAAGISLGALSAAVMERCYRDMHHCNESGRPRSEAARWSWFRRYLSFLLDRPYDVVWDAIPDPSDMVADLPPVREPNLPVNERGKTLPLAEELDQHRRRKMYIVAKLGSWLARIPVRVSSIAWLAVRYVRWHERYPDNVLSRAWNWLCLQINLLITLWRMLIHTSRPFWIGEWHFHHNGHPRGENGARGDEGEQKNEPPRTDRRQVYGRMPVRPLLGWLPWGASVIYCLFTIAVGAASAYFAIVEWYEYEPIRHWRWHVASFLLFLILPVVPVYLLWLMRRLGLSGSGRLSRWIAHDILSNLDIDQSLLSDFPLLLKLFRLFEDKGHSPKVYECKFPVLLVAAPLQILPSEPGQPLDGPNQLWAKVNKVRSGDENSQVSIIGALRACLAITPWFAPSVIRKDEQAKDRDGQPIERDFRGGWLRNPDQLERLDLVDGSAVRHNPLPALFRFLKDPGHSDPDNPKKSLAECLQGERPRVHLVYDVPIRWRPEPEEAPKDHTAAEPRLPNIVEAGFEGMRLAHRRDSRYEVLRTNEMSQIELTLRQCTGHETIPRVETINVDEIAPDDDLKLANQLKPTETETLCHIAAGCRQTLSVLYSEDLVGKTDCWEFLRKKADRRRWSEVPSAPLPGLAEVCRHCTRTLTPPFVPPNNLLDISFSTGAGKGDLAEMFPKLTGERPRIAFVASGGVFRGSFHIGMLGAMLALDIKPDLIVGSSVGTLMGAALGSIFKAKQKPGVGDEEARQRLHRMVNLFVNVDKSVALTKKFKAAAKDLGIRGRSPSLRLSPNELRKMVQRGSREDAGVAATGAPPALIDAISDLFLIPYNETVKISAQFIAGHFSEAIRDFWKQISTETIDRLDIHDAVLGASLIEKEMRQLLRDDIPTDVDDPWRALQPFLDDAQIAFFGTTVNLVTECIVTLGSELNRRSYDMMEALLASSAFPAAFAPRRASALYPGIGRRDMFYGDGGMFDNLPAMSAFQVLREVQKDHLRGEIGHGRWRDALVRRHQKPDLFIVGSLNTQLLDGLWQEDENPDTAKQEKHPNGARHEQTPVLYDSILKSAARARCLANNEKIYGLVRASEKVDRQLSQVESAAKVGKERRTKDQAIDPNQETFLNGIVNAAILPIYPRDPEHLNGTFQFCTSLGLDRDRVRRSISNGCFEMLAELHRRQAEPDSLVGRAIAANGLGRIEVRHSPASSPVCPYFQTGSGDLACPFHGADTIHLVCSADETHRGHADRLRGLCHIAGADHAEELVGKK